MLLPYAEIRAIAIWSIVLGGCFLLLNSNVIVYPTYWLTIYWNYSTPNLQLTKAIFISEFFLTTKIKPRLKCDQAYTRNLKLWAIIFSGFYLILCFVLHKNMEYLIYITCITYKHIISFVTYETSDVTMSNTCTNVICYHAIELA